MNVITGGQTPRAQLKEAAQKLAGQNLPYSSRIKAENDSFLQQLEHYQGDTLADLSASADKEAAALHTQAGHEKEAAQKSASRFRALGFASAGLGVAALVGYAAKLIPGPALAVVASAAIAGEIYGGVKSTGADNDAARADLTASAGDLRIDRFKADLKEWGQYFAAQS